MIQLTDALTWNGTGELETKVKVYGAALLELAQRRDDILCLSGDLTRQCEIDTFRDRIPERFFSVGMAEQNMIGVAAGLASEGENPFCHTFAAFATRRCYDQIVNAVAVPALPVRIAGFMPGLSSPGGTSHQAIDDLALMRILPNMTVIDLGEANEMAQAVAVAAEVDGPVYLRVRRNIIPSFLDGTRFRLAVGESYLLREGTDVGFIASGMMTERALMAAQLLQQQGVSAAVLHVPSIKPIDQEGIKHVAATTRLLISLDNHNIIGGLGSAVAEVLAEANEPTPLLRLGVRDRFAQCGSRDYLFQQAGLDPDQIASTAIARLNGASLEESLQHRNQPQAQGPRGWTD